MDINQIIKDIKRCFNDFICEFSLLEKTIININNASKYKDDYKSLKLKFKIIDTYLENIVKKRNFEIIDFSNNYSKIHQYKQHIEIIDSRIILFNTKSIGILEFLPEEMIFKIFNFMNEKDLLTLSKCGINILKIVNNYREHISLKQNTDLYQDVFYQKYLINKKKLYNQEYYTNIKYNKQLCYTMEPCNYSSSFFS